MDTQKIIDITSQSSIQYSSDNYLKEYIDENYTNVDRGDSVGNEVNSLETP